MKTTPIAEINQLEDGELVMRVEGEITKCYERKEGAKGDKGWSVQNLYLKDETGEMKVTVWDHDDLQPLARKRVSITAHKSDKGFSGIYAEDNEYPKGKITRQLRLTATANIQYIDQNKPAEADSNNVQTPSARPDARKASTPPPTNQNDSSDGFEDGLAQICNAQYLIKRAVRQQWEQAAVDGVIPAFETLAGNAHFQADCSSAFIKLDRAGLVESLSTKPVWKEAKKSVLPGDEF